jgi:ferredoxin
MSTISIWRVRSPIMNVRISLLTAPRLSPSTLCFSSDYSGACEGSVACSTCHVILPEEYYNLLPEPEDDENDMLDMAFGLTDTSRLGCQVKVTRELDGMTCTLPSATRNMFVDGMCLFFRSCPVFMVNIFIGKKASH